MILATFWDPNSNGFDITDVGTVLAVLAPILIALGIIARWAHRQLREEITEVVRREIAKATQPIQPGYRNGGESLADVSEMVRRIATHLEINP